MSRQILETCYFCPFCKKKSGTLINGNCPKCGNPYVKHELSLSNDSIIVVIAILLFLILIWRYI